DDIQDAASGPGQPAEDRGQAREKAGEPDRKEAFNLGGGEVSRGFAARVRVPGAGQDARGTGALPERPRAPGASARLAPLGGPPPPNEGEGEPGTDAPAELRAGQGRPRVVRAEIRRRQDLRAEREEGGERAL